MAEITRKFPKDAGGAFSFHVEWLDNDDVTRERYFKSYRAAGRFAVKIETDLLNEVVRDFATIKPRSRIGPQKRRPR